MANILLIANLNSDHVYSIDNTLQSGHRHFYQDHGKRLGGGGANTGVGLALAGHQVDVLTAVGDDELGHWLISQISQLGMHCHKIFFHPEATPEVLLFLDPKGERSIFKPQRAHSELPPPEHIDHYDLLYINYANQEAKQWARAALDQKIPVVCQYKENHPAQPCHYLITSETDFSEATKRNPWAFAQKHAGATLQGFIVTHAERGATLYTATETVHQPSVYQGEVVDSTGAGDVYVAGLIDAILAQKKQNEQLLRAAQWAATHLGHAHSIPGDALKQLLEDQA
jgi:sulfofructose kinase